MLKLSRKYNAWILGILFPLVASCGGNADKEDSTYDDVLVVVGDSTLTLRSVVSRIPAGLSRTDSVALFNSIVDGWLERMLLSEVGADNIDDMETIERMTDDYRRKLIVATYKRKLRESQRGTVSDESIREYYDKNQDSLLLERPVVKGLYVKVPTDSRRIADVRRWMVTATPDAIDNLERYGLSEAIEYSFFEDAWTDWYVISREIPYRFGNPDDFVSRSRNFETSYGGMTYFLHISEYIRSGEKMPLEIAREVISERLETLRGDKYEDELIRNIYLKSKKEGKLKFVHYDPINHKIIEGANGGRLPINTD